MRHWPFLRLWPRGHYGWLGRFHPDWYGKLDLEWFLL